MLKTVDCVSCGAQIPQKSAVSGVPCGHCGTVYIELENVTENTSSLVAAKCTECGDTLAVDPSEEATICGSCNNAFLTQKAIINYTLNTDVEEYIASGNNLLELGAYDKAAVVFGLAIGAASEDYRGRLGLLKARTENFTSPAAAEVFELREQVLLRCTECLAAEIKSRTEPYFAGRETLRELNAGLEETKNTVLAAFFIPFTLSFICLIVAGIITIITGSGFYWSASTVFFVMSLAGVLTVSGAFSIVWRVALKNRYRKIKAVEDKIRLGVYPPKKS